MKKGELWLVFILIICATIILVMTILSVTYVCVNEDNIILKAKLAGVKVSTNSRGTIMFDKDITK